MPDGGHRRLRTRWAAGPHLSWMLAGVLVAVGLVVTFWRPTAPPIGVVSTDLDRLSSPVASAIMAYRTPRRWAALVQMVLAVAVPVLVVASRPGRRVLSAVAGRRHEGWRGPGRGAAVAATVTLSLDLAQLPIQVWAGIVQDGAWQIRTATVGAWWARYGIRLGTDAVVAAAAGAGLVWLVRRRPSTWVSDAVVAGIGMVAAFALLYPVVVLPLLTPMRALDDGPAAREVLRTVADAGLDGVPILVAQRSDRDVRANAVVYGFGPTRRVVIDDTLLARPVDQVAAVMAHELAHLRHRDIVRGLLGSAVAVLALGVAVRLVWARPRLRRLITGVDDAPAGDPRVVAVALAVLAVLSVAGQPIALAQSRRVEAAADRASLDLGAAPATVVRLQRRLAIANLAPLATPWWQQVWWASHPTGSDRIRAAVAQAQTSGRPLPTRAELVTEEAADPPAWQRPGP